MQFYSYVDLNLGNKTIFSFNGAASFRANIYIINGSKLDFGNSDVFFDNANLHIKSGGSLINLPTKVARGYNMYGGTVEINGANFSGYDKHPAAKGVFHGENIINQKVTNFRLTNSRLYFTGGWGNVEFN